jgi:hypothetical protein
VSQLGVGNGTVARVWREHGIRPWRVETFKFSTDPELVAKVTDIVGLYLDPPENAIVLCVDEKSQIHALDRAAPTLRCRSGSPSVIGRPAGSAGRRWHIPVGIKLISPCPVLQFGTRADGRGWRYSFLAAPT